MSTDDEFYESELESESERKPEPTELQKLYQTAVSNIDDGLDRWREGAKLWRCGGGDDTDILIRCGGREWRAHRKILASRCSFFRTCFDCLEADTGVIQMGDANPFACEIFLEWIYTYRFESLDKLIIAGSFDDLGNVSDLLYSLFVMADKYDMPKMLAELELFLNNAPPLALSFDDHVNVMLNLLAALKTSAVEDIHNILIRGILAYSLSQLGPPHETITGDNRDFLESHGDVLFEIMIMMEFAHSRFTPRGWDNYWALDWYEIRRKWNSEVDKFASCILGEELSSEW